jgi:hypothetical protein
MNQTRFLFISALILGALIASACASQSIQQPQPDISTSLPAKSTPLTVVQTASEPPPAPSTGGEKTVTLDDRGKTISFAVGENFLLKLGEEYTWDISISDESIVSRAKNITVIRGAQGVYTALKPGSIQLTANGDPLCRQSKPACGRPSVAFEVTIEVK